MKSQWPVSAYWVSLKTWIHLTSFPLFSMTKTITLTHARTMHEHTSAHTFVVTDFFVYWYDLTPINHKVERLRVNVIQTAGAGTVGPGWMCAQIGAQTVLYSCWWSCHCSELWPWPWRWVGTWTHADDLALTRTPCFLPRFMLALSHFELTHKHSCIKPFHMAPNPIHSYDISTSHYALGKSVSYQPCTMTSCSMFAKETREEKKLPITPFVQVLTWFGEFQITSYRWCFYLFFYCSPLFFISPLRFQTADRGQEFVKNRSEKRGTCGGVIGGN